MHGCHVNIWFNCNVKVCVNINQNLSVYSKSFKSYGWCTLRNACFPWFADIWGLMASCSNIQNLVQVPLCLDNCAWWKKQKLLWNPNPNMNKNSFKFHVLSNGITKSDDNHV